ncbi:phosphate regulon sensor histidine kinase PhoR [Flocculibacter collagenilyticus]|uniref:phosphate regulon sensor histidine kinase PhoR n=1 Tax=Flocculibacter collagenilyticus TaxID=2744479 RepID=UPI0018F48129|nr:phosphate regulon sensor histidine kinase PhoR [Flocculibacter collagenilyticus]
MHKSTSISDLLTTLAIYFSLAGVFGFLIGFPFAVLFICALGLLGWHYRQVLKMNEWLWHRKSFIPPQGQGSWASIFDGVYRIQLNNRKKRNELKELIRRFREGAEALPDAAIVMDNNLNILWCNKLSQLFLGLRWPHDKGQRIDNLLRHPDFVRYIHSNDFNNPLEQASPLNDEVILEYRVMPYGAQQLMLIARDITQVKQLEQMRKDFVANVSHELRTPLTVLQGYLEMFDESLIPEQPMWGKAHQMMTEQTHRMDSLVTQLLSLSRIEASSQQEFEEVVDVPAMLNLIKTEAATLNADKAHTLSFNIDASLIVYGMKDELRSAMSNLIFNAVQYTPASGLIEITWALKNNSAYFAVNDNGEGIPAEHLPRITERFYRLDRARSRKTGGSGLGLSIVKHALSRHNSHLEINSEVGKGSTFYFTLPNNLTVSKQEKVAG